MVLPATYKAAQFQEKGGRLVIVDKPLVLPKEGEILIKTIACGVCHSDNVVKTDMFGAGFPKVPGHEFIGDIVAVAPGETKWSVGERVGAGWLGSFDESCEQCEHGTPYQCKNAGVNGLTREGGFAEYVLVRREAAASIPMTINPTMAAPLLCAGVTVFRPIDEIKHLPKGALVAVQGLGGLGHLAVQFLKKKGYTVAALSRGTDKQNLATQLGADLYLSGSGEEQAASLQELGGAHIIVITGTNAKAASSLLEGLAVRGTMILIGVFEDGPMSFSSWTLTNKDLSIKGSWIGGPKEMEQTLKFSSNTGVATVYEAFPLEKINDAWDAMESGTVRFRAVVTF